MSRTAMNGARRAYDRPAEESWWTQGQDRQVKRHRKPKRLAQTGREAIPNGQPSAQLAEPVAAGALTLSKALMYITVGLLMLLLFMQIGRLAQIASRSKRISALQTSIREMENEQNNLQVRLSMQQNINRVRDEAVYNLGMVRPEEGQIRVVSLQDHSVNARTQTADMNLVGGATE